MDEPRDRRQHDEDYHPSLTELYSGDQMPVGDLNGDSRGRPVARDGATNEDASTYLSPTEPEQPQARETAPRFRETEEEKVRVDVTSIIQECASLLTVSDPFVCNKESFSLHDSMAATELTDRTMDCCEIPASCYSGRSDKDNGKFVFPRPPPQSLDDPFALLPWENLSSREVAFVAVKMLGCLQAFLSGSSVGESTFTCLYAHSSVLRDMHRRLYGDSATGFETIAPQALVGSDPLRASAMQFYLFACAVALVDATDMVRTVVVNADIYEEEDFSPNTYDIPFYNEAVEVPMIRLIDEATSSLTKSASRDVDPNLHKLNEAVLGFFRCFMSVCSALSKLTAENLQNEVESTQLLCREAIRNLDIMDEILSSVSFDEDEDLRNLYRRTFDPYVNRPLVGNTPVRKPVSRSDRGSVRVLRGIMNELDWAVCGLLLRGTTLARVQRTLDRVQRSDVNVLGRSFIVLNLFFDEKLLGQHAMDKLISDDMRRWRDLPDTFTEFELTLSFLERLAKPIYDSLKLRTLNRCRQRNYIEAVMINDWVSLQSEAHMIDVHYREYIKAPRGSMAPYLTQYVLLYVLATMDRHLAVGLELQIYRSPLDACMAYWYRDFLLSALLNNLSTVRATKSVPVKDNGQNSDSARQKQEDSFEMMLVSVQRDVCRGLKRFLVALQQVGIIRVPSYQFTRPERIFHERFSAFASILHPPPLTYDDFAQGCDYAQVDAKDLQATTSSCFLNAKAAIDHLLKEVRLLDAFYVPLPEAELRALMKVCVGNNIYLVKLKSLEVGSSPSTTSPTTQATMSFEGMSPFCTVKLT